MSGFQAADQRAADAMIAISVKIFSYAKQRHCRLQTSVSYRPAKAAQSWHSCINNRHLASVPGIAIDILAKSPKSKVYITGFHV